MALPKVASYLHNVSKSIAYASVEAFKEDIPTIASIVDHDSNREVYKAIYSGVKDYRTTLSRATRYIQSSKIYRAADLGIKSAIEDIQSGKWYNVERSRALENAIVDDVFGGDDDMDFSFKDSDDPSDSISRGDKMIAAQTEVSSSKAAGQVSSTIIKTTEAQMKAHQASTNLLYAQNAKLMGELRTDITNLGARNIQEISKTNKYMENLATNSQKFFESTTKTLNEMAGMQKEMLEMQRNMYTNARNDQNKKKDDSKVGYDDLFNSEGVLDLKAYGKSIKRNAKNTLSDKTGGMLDVVLGGMGGEQSFLDMFAANPGALILPGLIRGTMSKQLQKSLKDLDRSLAGAATTAVARMNRMAKDEDANPIMRTLGQIFGFKLKTKTTLDVNKFTKGPVPFDGITRATINNAIPIYLSRIESALTGKPALIYNPYTGRWRTAKGIHTEFENMGKQAVKSGTSDVGEALVRQILHSKKYKAASTYDKEKIERNIEKFLQKLYDNDGDFKLKSYDDWYEAGVEGEDMLKMIMGALRNIPNYTRLQASKEVFEAKQSLTKRMEALEEQGSIYAHILAGAFDKSEYKDLKYTPEPQSKLASTLSLATDDKGKNLWFYLQNMYSELYRIRNTIGGGSGGNGVRGVTRQFRSMDSPLANIRGPKTAKQRYNENERNRSIKYNEDIQKFVDEGGKVYDISDGETMRRILNNMAEEDRKKAQESLAKSSNWFQRVMYQDAMGITPTDGNDGKGTKATLKRFKEATLDKKFKMITSSLQQLTSKPNEHAVKLIQAADKRIYDFFYGAETGKEDKDKHKIRGFMNLMSFKIDTTLNGLAEKFEKNILGPLKEKLGIENMSDVLDKLGISGFVNGIFDKILGPKVDGKREGGMLSEFGKKFSEAITEKAKSTDQWIKNAFTSVLSPITNRIKAFKGPKTQDVTLSDEEVANEFGNTNTIHNGKIINTNTSRYVDRFRTALKNKDEFHKDLINMILTIIKAFKQHQELAPIVADMFGGKKSYLFNIDMVSNIKKEDYLGRGKVQDQNDKKIINSLLVKLVSYIRSTKDIINYNELFAELRWNGPGAVMAEKVINAHDKACRESYTAIRKFSNKYKTDIDRYLVDATKVESPAEARERLFERDMQERRRLQDYISNNAGADDAKEARRLIRIIEQTHADRLNGPSVFESSDVKEDEYVQKHEKFSALMEQVYKKINIDSNKEGNYGLRNMLSIMLWPLYNEGQDIKKLTATQVYNMACASGRYPLAEYIEKIITTKYNNSDLTIGQIMSSSSSSKPITTGGGLFDKATDILEKIYHLLALNFDISRFKGSNALEELASTDSKITNITRAKRNRESKTESTADGDDSHSDEPPGAHAFGGFFTKRSLSALSKDEIYGRNGLFGKVPKTGVYDVKAGTTIYPTNKTDKAIELAGEQRAIEKYIKSNAKGDNAVTKEIDGKVYTKVTNDDGEEVWARMGEDGKWHKLVDTTLMDRAVNKAKSAVGAVKSAVNMDNARYSRVKIKVEGRPAGAIAEDIKKNVPGISAGAALGAAAGLLFGNPMLGAALGGSISLVQVSDAAKNMLFGEQITEADGTTGRKGGVVSKHVQDLFKKHAPEMSKHALVGATLGLFTPFGLIGGALLGATAGYVKSSDSAMISLFGDASDPDSGIISKNSRDKLKKLAPNLLAGAAGAALLGPFGLIGNLAVGAGLGFVSTTDEFKNAILGEEVDIGGEKTRVGGIIGTLNTDLVMPLKDWGRNFAADISDFTKEKVLKPLGESIQPIVTELTHMGKSIIKFVPGVVKGIFDMVGNSPLGGTLSKVLAPARTIAGGLSAGATTLAKGTILAPVTAVHALGSALRNKQVKGGYATYMTAEERMSHRNKAERGSFASGLLGNRFGGKDDKFADADATMSKMDAKGIDETLKLTKILISDKDFKRDIKAKKITIKRIITSYFDAKAYKRMSRLAQKELFDELIADIKSTPPREGVTDKQVNDVIELIKSLKNDIEMLHNDAFKSKEAKDEAYEKLQKAGFKGINRKNIGNLKSLLEKEKSHHLKVDAAIDPAQQHMEDNVTKNADKITMAIIDIRTTLEKALFPEKFKEKSTLEKLKEAEKIAKDEEAPTKTTEVVDSNDSNSDDIPEGEAPPKKLDRLGRFISRMKDKRASRGIRGSWARFKMHNRLSRIPTGKFDQYDPEIQNNTAANRNIYTNPDLLTYDSEENEVISLNNNKIAFRGRMAKESTDKERIYYDSDSNAVRVFRKTITGWKEVEGKGKRDADKRETDDDTKKMTRLAKLIEKFRGKGDDDDEDNKEKKKGFLSKITGFLGKGLGTILKGLGIITGVAGIGHLATWGKETAAPAVHKWWDEKAKPWFEEKVKPWIEEKLGKRIAAIPGAISDFVHSIPSKIQQAFEWMNEHKDKVLTWYADGLKAFGGIIQSGFQFVVSNLPRILWAFGKNVMLPAIKGIFGGITSWFKKKNKSYKDYPLNPDNSIIDSNASTEAINKGKEGITSLGGDPSIMTSYSTDLSSGAMFASDITEAQAEKYTNLNEKHNTVVKAKDQGQINDIVQQATDNARMGAITTDTGEVIEARNHDLMLKDEFGSTMVLDEDGNAVSSNDNVSKGETMGKRIVGRTARMLLTGVKGINGPLLKGLGLLGRAPGAAMVGLGKVMTKIPGLKTIGKGTVGIGKIAQIGGRATQKFGEFWSNTATMANVAEKGAAAITTGLSNLSSFSAKIIERIIAVFEKLFQNKTVSNLIGKIMTATGHDGVTGATVASKLTEVLTGIYSGLDDLLTKIASRGISGFAQKAGAFLSKAAVVITIVMAVKDFLDGWNNANSMLGIIDDESIDYEITNVHRFLCALLKVLNGFLAGLIPEDWVCSMLIEKILPLFGVDTTAIQKARADSEEALARLNTEGGTEYDSIEAYNKRNSFGTKMKKALASAGDKVKEAWNSFTGKSTTKTYVESETKDKPTKLKNHTMGTGSEDIDYTFNDNFVDIEVATSRYGTGSGNTTKIEAINSKISSLVAKGDLSKIVGMKCDVSKSEKEDDSFSGITSVISLYLSKIAAIPVAAFQAINTNIDAMFGKSSNTTNVSDMVKKMRLYIDTTKYRTMTGFDNIGKSTNSNSIVSNLVATIVRSVARPIIEVLRGVEEISKLSSGSNSTSRTVTVRRTTSSAYGTGRAYQRDPSVANIPFTRSGDTAKQTIGNSGCGPAAAVNAVNYAYGTGNNIVEAASQARSYKEKNGGTRPEFFTKYFKERGLESSRLSGSQIEKSIRSGNPVVLMGQDSRGGGSTPYGPNPHYVTAKGFDRKGNIVVDDPESPIGSIAYNKNKVLGHTSIAVGARRKRRHGRSKYGLGAKKGKPNIPYSKVLKALRKITKKSTRSKYGRSKYSYYEPNIEEAKQVIWSFLINKGYNENSAAAIMGNICQECGYNYAAWQGAYKQGPGIGICQWTYKTRKEAFLAAVPDWEVNLMGQLEFMWSEISSGYTKCLPETLNTKTSIDEAVTWFHDIYEGSADSTMSKRIGFAKEAFRQFTGTEPIDLSGYSSSSSSFSEQAAVNSDLSQGGDTMMGQLGTKIGKLVRSALAVQYGHTSLKAIFGDEFDTGDDLSSSSSGAIAAPSVSTTTTISAEADATTVAGATAVEATNKLASNIDQGSGVVTPTTKTEATPTPPLKPGTPGGDSPQTAPTINGTPVTSYNPDWLPYGDSNKSIGTTTLTSSDPSPLPWLSNEDWSKSKASSDNAPDWRPYGSGKGKSRFGMGKYGMASDKEIPDSVKKDLKAQMDDPKFKNQTITASLDNKNPANWGKPSNTEAITVTGIVGHVAGKLLEFSPSRKLKISSVTASRRNNSDYEIEFMFDSDNKWGNKQRGFITMVCATKNNMVPPEDKTTASSGSIAGNKEEDRRVNATLKTVKSDYIPTNKREQYIVIIPLYDWLNKSYKNMMADPNVYTSSLSVLGKKSSKEVYVGGSDVNKSVSTVLKEIYNLDKITEAKSYIDTIKQYATYSLEKLNKELASKYGIIKALYKVYMGANPAQEIEQTWFKAGFTVGDFMWDFYHLNIDGKDRSGGAASGNDSTGGDSTGNYSGGDYSGGSYDSTSTSTSTSSSGGKMGSIFDLFKSAFSSAFNYKDSDGNQRNLLELLGLGGSSSFSSETTPTTANSKSSGMSAEQTKVKELLDSIMGKNEYSQESNRTQVGATLEGASQGYGDCSSTAQWLLKTGAGVDPGDYTGAQIESSKGQWVDGPYDFGQQADISTDKLAFGDLMFYGSSGSGNPRKVSHVEMFYGNGKKAGHGHGWGPALSEAAFNYKGEMPYLGSKRFIPVGGTEEETGSVSGLSSSGSMANNFPFFNQSDPAWGNKLYGKEGTLSSSGCGPTTYAMIAKSFGNTVTPADTADWFVSHGHRVYGSGTDHQAFQDMSANVYGINASVSGPSMDFMVNNLKSGNPMIASMKPPTFTSGGHFITLVGMTEDGKILVNDPAGQKGIARTGKSWDPSLIVNESKKMWAFNKDGEGSIGGFKKGDDVTSMSLDEVPSISDDSTNLEGDATKGMGSGNYQKLYSTYGRSTSVDYSSWFETIAGALEQLVSNTSLLAKIVQILTSGSLNGGGITAEQAAAIARASAGAASNVTNTLNGMKSLNKDNLGSILSSADTNQIIQTMTRLATQ